MLQAGLGRVPSLRPVAGAVPSLVSLALGGLAVTSLRGSLWLAGAALAVGCAAAAEPYTVLAGVQAAVTKVTPDVLAGIVVLDATVAVVAGWRAAAVLTAGGVLVVTTLLVGWFRLRERFDHFVRWGAGVDLAPRRLTGQGWLIALVGWVGAAALVLLVSRLLGGDPRQSQTGSLWIPLASLWCGYWVRLPSLDWVARQPRLSRRRAAHLGPGNRSMGPTGAASGRKDLPD